MATQFPPSSPLLGHTEKHDDPFNSFSHGSPKKLVLNTPFNRKAEGVQEEYPTPNPSSSVGNRGSSPVRNDHKVVRSEIEQEHVKDLEDTHRIVNTQKPLKVLLYPNEKVTLGRSSRCDYFMKTKFASRIHMKLQYTKDEEELTVLCKGSNPLVVMFNKREYGNVARLEEGVYFFNRKIQGDNAESYEELKVFSGEQLTVPYNEKLSISVMDYTVIVEVTSDESETEDEIPVLRKRLSSIEATEQMKEVEPDHLQTPTDKPIRPAEVAPMKNLSRGSTPVLLSSDSFEPETITKPAQTSAKAVRAKSEEPESDSPEPLKLKIALNRSKSVEVKDARLPLVPRSTNELNKDHSDKIRRTRKAESGLSPLKKRPEHLQPRQKIEGMNIDHILKSVPDFESIHNLITNHLAFSRLAQTPLTQLHAVSAMTQKLTIEQMRAVLAALPRIGVIYRQGKDAAGNYLDEEYYYDIEKDLDEERVKLVNSLKGGGLRNCRKTHKQYFWKKPGTKK